MEEIKRQDLLDLARSPGPHPEDLPPLDRRPVQPAVSGLSSSGAGGREPGDQYPRLDGNPPPHLEPEHRCLGIALCCAKDAVLYADGTFDLGDYPPLPCRWKAHPSCWPLCRNSGNSLWSPPRS